MNCPAHYLTVSESLDHEDAYDSLVMCVHHVQHTVAMVEIALTDAADSGDVHIAPAVMAATLNGVETHLAAINAMADRLMKRAQEVSQ